VAIFGMSSNLFVLIFIQRIDSIRKPFVQTSISQMIGDFTVLLTFAAYAAPLTLFSNIDWFKNDQLNRFMGQLNISAYVACTYTHLLRSSCRFMAISYPINHSRIFTMRNTIIALFLIWIYAILQTMIYYIDGCSFYYSISHYGFIFADTPCGNAIKVTVDFAQYLVVIAIVAILDAITIFRIHRIHGRVRVNETETQLRRNREIRLFVQAVLQDSAFLLLPLCSMFISSLMTSKWSAFFCTTFIWELVHSLDGVIAILCNPGLRLLLLPRWLRNDRRGRNGNDPRKKAFTQVANSTTPIKPLTLARR
uniref:G-protein coupled receptors family 1 profile domain-containing protein n=2 Tax=Parascaris univalens TaxID=6257 RepID=A0A915AYS5_PARUN